MVMRVADVEDFDEAFEEMAKEKASASGIAGILTRVHCKKIRDCWHNTDYRAFIGTRPLSHQAA